MQSTLSKVFTLRSSISCPSLGVVQVLGSFVTVKSRQQRVGTNANTPSYHLIKVATFHSCPLRELTVVFLCHFRLHCVTLGVTHWGKNSAFC